MEPVKQQQQQQQQQQMLLEFGIHSISMHSPLPTFLQWWISPFLLGYSLFGVLCALSLTDAPTTISLRFLAETWFFIAAEACLLLIHIFVMLFRHWSVNFKCWTSYKRSQLPDTTTVLVTPDLHKGSSQLCPIVHPPPRSNASPFFVYQKCKFQYDRSSCSWKPLPFPVTLPIDYYRNHRGYTDPRDIENAYSLWGQNYFDIPQPTFSALFKEQALAPFFVFQLFCVGLWCLDDYPHYALFMLILLLIFEATVVKSRLRNFDILHDMIKRPTQMVYVYRHQKWGQISSDRILPGDILSITRSRSSSQQKNNSSQQIVCPCDVLLLSGTAVVNEAMLTGESTPHLKEPIASIEGLPRLDINGEHKQHVISAGTVVIQHTTAEKGVVSKPPDSGCLGYVLRTGFDTSQGRLMRTILFSNERVTANNRESLLFILFLLIFALAASGYVLIQGLEDPLRSRWKLFLNCSTIITSVVPPELPMELSLAVNTSLVALKKLGVFCTEPFRIPFAGAIDICCFDKTGTLTSDDLNMIGVHDPSQNVGVLNSPTNLPLYTTFVLAGCHSLVHLDGQLVGEPIETASLTAINWHFTKGDIAVSRSTDRHRCSLRVVNRFPFTSSLKRMSTIISLEHESRYTCMITAKGAPEVMGAFFNNAPADYAHRFKWFSRQGARVLALGYRLLEDVNPLSLKNYSRDQVESNLTFAGFVVFECPLKPDSSLTVEKLRNSSHEVAMITGDNSLTSCHVARELHIATRPGSFLILTSTGNTTGTSLEWVSVDEETRYPFEQSSLRMLSDTHDLCITGDTFDGLMSVSWGIDVLHHVRVFARVSPDQKESILSSMKSIGLGTLMCGDGTNDVGALKQAHVGAALLNSAPPPSESNQVEKHISGKKKLPRSLDVSRKTSRGLPPTHHTETNKTQRMLKEIAESQNTVVKLGDASIASPFTCKSTSVKPVLDIIRQGRCTLVTTLQMYRILALNCLVSAYCLSVLYLDGVRLGDTQAVILGMLIAFCFLFISRSAPVTELSKQRPPTSVFCPYMIISIILQFGIHLGTLLLAVDMTRAFIPTPTVVNEDDEFVPNLLNSSVFLMSCSMQVSTFAVNYRGKPFMSGLLENRGLLTCLLTLSGITIVTALEILPEWNEYFEIAPFPSTDFGQQLAMLMVGDFFLAFGSERVLQFVFSA